LAQHGKGKRYFCTWIGCQRKFTWPSRLRDHLRTHTEHFLVPGMAVKRSSRVQTTSDAIGGLTLAKTQYRVLGLVVVKCLSRKGNGNAT
jgi:hypothetical protein